MNNTRQFDIRNSRFVWDACSRVGAPPLIALCLCPLSRPEDLDLSQQVLLLSTLRTSTLEKELKQTAGAGYRILFVSNIGSGSVGGGFPQSFTEHNQLVLGEAAGTENVDSLFIKQHGDSPANSITFLESDMNEAAAKVTDSMPARFWD